MCIRDRDELVCSWKALAPSMNWENAYHTEALKAYKAAGVEVYGRVDVLLREEDGAPFVLEINTIPGMTPSSLLPKAAAASG